MQQLSGAWGELVGWATILAGLASAACVIALIDRRRSVAPRTHAEPAKLERAQEWELVMRRATEELSRGAELAALQAASAVKIEAAEHAYNRLVADCARFCRLLGAVPPRDPVPFPGRPETPPSTPEMAPEQRRLAA